MDKPKNYKSEFAKFVNINGKWKYYETEQDYIDLLNEEIDRLNNIINELEKEMKQEYTVWMCKNKSYGKTVQYGIDIAREHYYKRLQELKENKQ